MRRFFMLSMVLVMVVSLCACAKSGTGSPSGTQKATGTTTVGAATQPGTTTAKTDAQPGATTAKTDAQPGITTTKTDAPPATTTAKPDSNPLDKTEGAVEIVITPPDGWVKNDGSVLPVHYMNGTASFMAKEESFSNATLDEVVDEALGMFQNSFDNVEVVGEVEPITVDDKDARKLTFTCTVGTMQMKYTYVYLFAADKTFAITFGDLAASFDSLSGDYETILSTIRFEAQ